MEFSGSIVRAARIARQPDRVRRCAAAGWHAVEPADLARARSSDLRVDAETQRRRPIASGSRASSDSSSRATTRLLATRSASAEDDRNNGVHIVRRPPGCEAAAGRRDRRRPHHVARCSRFEQTVAPSSVEPLLAEQRLEPAERRERPALRRLPAGLDGRRSRMATWRRGATATPARRANGAPSGPTGAGRPPPRRDLAARRRARRRSSGSARRSSSRRPSRSMPYERAGHSADLDGARERGAREVGARDGDARAADALATSSAPTAIDARCSPRSTHPARAPPASSTRSHGSRTPSGLATAIDLAVERSKRGAPLGAHDLVLAEGAASPGCRAAHAGRARRRPRPRSRPGAALERGLADAVVRGCAAHASQPAADVDLAADAASMAGSLMPSSRRAARRATFPTPSSTSRRAGWGVGAAFSQNLGRYVRSPCLLPDDELVAHAAPFASCSARTPTGRGSTTTSSPTLASSPIDRDTNTGVVVVARLLGCDLQRAMVDRRRSRSPRACASSSAIVADELGPLLDELGIGGPQRADVPGLRRRARGLDRGRARAGRRSAAATRPHAGPETRRRAFCASVRSRPGSIGPMRYKILGFVVWQGARWYVRRRIVQPRPVAQRRCGRRSSAGTVGIARGARGAL